MKKLGKIFMIALTVLMLFSVIAGCSGDNSNGVSNNSDNDKAGTKEADEGAAKEIPTYKLTFLDHGTANYTEKPKYYDETMKAINDKLSDDLGFKVEINYISYADDVFKEKLNLDLAAGESYDLIRLLSGQDFIDLVNKGMLKDMTSIIENSAPNHMENITQNVWDEVTVGGKKYGLPVTGFKVIMGTGWIRGDWLEKAGLEIPTTIEEMENVMKVFKEGDLDGNGENDTLPFATVNDYAEMMFLGLFTDTPGDFVDDSGKVRAKYYDPGYKQYIELLRDWYAKGYIDDQLFNGNDNTISELFTQNKLGIAGTNVWNLEWGPINGVHKNRPEVNIKFVKQFDKQMKKYYCPGLVTDIGAASATAKNVEYAVKFHDWYLYDSENYHMVMNGIKGKSYDIVDNAVVVPEGEDAESVQALKGNIGLLNSVSKAFEYYPATTPEESKKAYDYAVKELPTEKLYVPVTRYINPEFEDSVKIAKGDADDMVKEYIGDMIRGEKDMSAYDEMLRKYEEMAGEYFEILTEEYANMN